MQAPPSIELAGFIRHYLFLDLPQAATRKLRLFPDGSTGIVLNSSPNLVWNSQLLPEAFFYGQLTEYKELSSISSAQMVVIVFHPHAIHRLLDVPAGQLNDQVVPLDMLFGDAATTLQSTVATTDSWTGKFTLVENFFRTIASRREPLTDPFVSKALEIIRQTHGAIPILQLAGHLGCHSRQLERKFGTSVGLSPKQFCNIVRTLHFVRSLQANETRAPLTGATYESGYYDQAHGIRQFRKATGLTPSNYLKKATPLALNFLIF